MMVDRIDLIKAEAKQACDDFAFHASFRATSPEKLVELMGVVLKRFNILAEYLDDET